MRLLRPLAAIWTVILGCTATTLALGLAARMLLPLSPWGAAPVLVDVAPADGAAAVLPSTPITLNFSQPMNRQTTLAAISITPPTPGQFNWSADGRTLTFQPTPALSADVTYTVRVDRQALGRWWRPLETDYSVVFRTAPLPAVIAALPSGAGAPADTSIAVVFSQPMIPPEQAGEPATVPQLSFEPPFAANLIWANPNTLLIRPAVPLRAAAHYTGTVSADLSDLRGVALGQPFTWSFATAWPEVIRRSPASGERWASPRQPLTLTLAAPVDPDLLRQALTIDPPLEGDLSASVVGSTQLITFTPRLGWQPGETYNVSLAAPAGSGLSTPPDLHWRFTVEPPPGLLAFFPGQGQTLPPGQAVRLIFSTPMDEEALRAGLSIDPPVDDLPISVSEAEVRLRPELQPSTVYTITVAAGTLDRSGEPLAAPAQVSIRTGPAAPALRSPTAPGGIVTIPVSGTAAVELERINLSRLDLALYRLDTPTLLRAFGFGPSDWRDFQPERYGQGLARSWQLTLNDPPDSPARDPLPIGPSDGRPLDPGAYYLRAVSREGPRIDLLVLVSSVRLTMRQGESQVLIWATDAESGAPRPGVPVSIYAGDALLTRGVTGPDGVWEQPIQRSPQDPPYLAVAEGPEPALVSAAWAAPTANEPRTRALLLLDALEYRPGAIVRLAGQARRIAADGSLALPAASTSCRLQLVADGGPVPLPPLASDCRVAADGVVTGSIRLDSRIAPGSYAVRAQVGDATRLLALRVSDMAGRARLRVAQAGPDSLTLQASSADAPLPGAVVTWSLSLEPLARPAIAADYRFAEIRAPAPSSGSGVTDAEGRLVVDLPTLDAAAGSLRYRLRAELDAPGGLRTSVEELGLILAPGPQVGLRLPTQALSTVERANVELLLIDGAGQPLDNAVAIVEVFPGADPDGNPLLVRQARSGADGRASAQLVQLNPGRYTVIARAGDSRARADLWVAGGSYSGWENEPGRVSLIPDRAAYSPGDTARLLITAPADQAELLLTVERGDLRSYEVRPLQAGQLITLTVSPDMAPAVGLGAVLSIGGERLTGNATLRVIDDSAPLSVTVVADRSDYLPGDTAAITVGVAEAGAPTPADLVLAIAPEAALAPGPAADQEPIFRPGTPARLSSAIQPQSGQVAQSPAQAQASIAPPGYLVPVEGGAGAAGMTVAQARLPDQPGRWRVTAYAFVGTSRTAVGSTVITTSLPIELMPQAPLALRPGDEAAAGLIVRNSSEITRSLQISVSAVGLSLADGQPNSQRLTLRPGEARRLSWDVRAARDAGAAVLRYRVQADDIDELVERQVMVLGEADPLVFTGETLAGTGDLRAEVGAIGAGVGLEVALAPNLRAAVASAAAELAARDERDVEQRAALLLISAGLAREGPADQRARWRDLATQAWDELAAAQNPDGGWGWWPGSPSDPFVSAFAIEAQAAGRAALGSTAQISLRGIGHLERAAATAEPELRAYIVYALARAGRADILDLATPLLGADLSPDGLAYLAASLPASRAAPTLERLISLANSDDPDGFLWQAHDTAPLPRTPLAVSAAATQVLRARMPSAAVLPAAERSLYRAWGVDGWPSAYETARVAAALLPGSGSEPAAPHRLLLDERALHTGPISTTLRLSLAPDQIAPGASLAVEAPADSRYLLAYAAPADPPAATPERPLLQVRYLNPQSGANIDPDRLQVGQLIALEVTLVSPHPLLRADLLIDLPAGLELLATTSPEPFGYQRSDAAGRQVELGAARLPAGVYSARIVARVTGAGSFEAAPPRLISRLSSDPPASGDEPLRIRVLRAAPLS